MTWPIVQTKIGEKNYPKLLAQISDPPKMLYCRGNLDLLNSECMGVVGTRKLTPYGKESAQYITRGLATAGFTIVSGLAMGIDAVAHQTTLETGGKTIAVLGSGVDDKNIGPQINYKLAMDILKNRGLVTSEYPEGFHANEKTFPQRNRIISGLSRGVLIVEADKESGALITAYSALDQNRDVFAVPGSIFSSKSLGPHDLIKKGAKLIVSAQDIIDEYGHNLHLFDENSNMASPKNPTEQSIIAILKERGETTADEIINESGLGASQVLSSLSLLEVRGVLKNIGNGKYRSTQIKT